MKLHIGESGGNVAIALGDSACELPPDQARAIAVEIAARAYKIRYGTEPPHPLAEISKEMRNKVNDEVRARMINRVSIMLPSLQASQKTPGYIAMQIVDSVMAEVAT